MPEGDTIHTVARVMAPDLVGRPLLALEVAQRPIPLQDARVTRCEAVGKHLLIDIAVNDKTHTVRVHLGMKGSWHRYRPGEPWRMTPSQRRLVLQTGDWLFVCFSPKEVELTAAHAYVRPQVTHLGPDLLGPTIDLAEVVRRARQRAELAIADLLLDQSVAAGIGNVYKSELCFIERLSPFLLSREVSDDKLASIYGRARELMRDNLDAGGWRITTTRPLRATGFTRDRTVRPEQRHWVYRRARRPCLVCATLIRSRLQGEAARMTYWCPSCQR
jgi:endonuclease-8